MPDVTRWLMTAPDAPLRREISAAQAPAAGHVLVEVAGCGVCHTDLGFYYEGVRTRAPLPLALGHEVAGFVRAAGDGAEGLLGQAVIVPAVLPCGRCAMCQAGLGTMCPEQFMPGNDGHGGFASHLEVPAAGLCPVPNCTDPDQDLGGVTLRDLSVLADAASTAYQSLLRAEVPAGGTVVVVGCGGVGIYAVQLARAMGAQVVAIDVDEARLAQAVELGAHHSFDASGDGRAIKKAVGAIQRTTGVAGGLRVLECSGSTAGQELAFSLLGPAGVLLVVGFTSGKVTIRLSRLMALDARALGNWGCLPELYPPLLSLVLDGSIQVAPLVQRFPLDDVQAVLEAVKAHEIRERPVLVP